MSQAASSRQRERSALPGVVERGLDAVQRHLPARIEWRVRKAALIVIHVARQSARDDVPGLSAELAYRAFLAIFPFAIFLTALGGFLARSLPIENPTEQAIDLFGQLLPSAAQELVAGELRNIIQNQSAGLISFGVILAIFFATGGSNALIKAINRAYSVGESRPFWRRYLVALVMTLITGLALITAFVLIVPVRLFAQPIAEAIGIGNAAAVLPLVGIAFGMALLVIAVSLAFRIAPNIDLPLRSVVPGAVLFAVSWLVATMMFTYWVANFGNYASTYGALAGVVIVLIWFYASSALLLISAEVNEIIHRLTQPEDLDRRRDEAKRGSAHQASATERPAERGEDEKGLIERIEAIGPESEAERD